MNQPVTHIALVRAAFNQPFQITVDRIDCPWKTDLYKLGMPADNVANPMALIPERPWHRRINQIATREGIPDLGLHIDNSVPFGDIASMSFPSRSSDTLQGLLATFCQ